nr:putative ribonuclease H-like domain-containing protein [Tanacetum cinerariifolium]
MSSLFADTHNVVAILDKSDAAEEDVIREILQLDDAEGVVCLPNEEIFAGLAQMGYEKPSTKLTFYKAFFSSQWKFLIHTLLQSLSAKRTSWNEFSMAMSSAVFANMRRVEKGFSGVETPLFEGMLVARQLAEACIAEEQVQADDTFAAAIQENVAKDVANDAIPSPPSHDIPSPSQEQSSPPQQPQSSPQAPPQDEGIKLVVDQVKDADIAETDERHAAEQAKKQAEIYHLDLDHPSKVFSMQEDDSKVQEVVEVVTTAKLITDVVTAASQVSAASATIYAAKPSILAAAPTDETNPVLKTFIIGLENLLSLKVKVIRCNDGTEFKNSDLNQLCGLKGIKREFSVPRTPQQNGIAERKNRTLIEAARTLLADSLLPIPFWAEAVNTACYVQNRETLYVNFMENKPNVAGSGPAWLFDIDSLTRTMNYHPVITGNQTNSHASFQDTEKAGEEGTHTYVLFPVLSDGSTNSQNNNKDDLVDGKEHDDDIQKCVSPNIHSLSSDAQTRKQGDNTGKKDKGKSPVVTITGFRDLNAKFKECTNNSSNRVNAASSSVSTAGHYFINNTNDFSAAGPSNAAASPTAANSSDMPNLKDLTHSDDVDDVGAKADLNNLESIISV